MLNISSRRIELMNNKTLIQSIKIYLGLGLAYLFAKPWCVGLALSSVDANIVASLLNSNCLNISRSENLESVQRSKHTFIAAVYL